MSDLLEKAEKYIPADVRLISGCKDEQTSADVSNVESFQLPDPAGRAGGACTSAMLSVLYADHTDTAEDLTFEEVVLKIRDNLSENFSQIPQLSSSRPININERFNVAPEGSEGTRRAVMIGINYTGQDGELSGCWNDVKNMTDYIKDVHDFEEENITTLLDDGEHTDPTKENILAAYAKLVSESEEGDIVFCHFSGHGGKLRDDNGDEDDGFDESLVPLDYSSAGQIRDDDLFKQLVCAMPKGVTMTCVFDCCHSGTVLDLPYIFIGDGEHEEMESAEGFDFSSIATYLGAGAVDFEDDEDNRDQVNQSAAAASSGKKNPLFCCFGGKPEESDDEFEGEDGFPAGHRKVIVIGANGMVGRAVLPVLHFRYGEHLQVYAGTRDPTAFAPIEGVNVVKADMADKKSLTKTLKHFDRAMIVVPNNRPDLAANALEAADAAKNINFVLVLSVLTAPLKETIFGKHFGEIEAKAKQVFPASYCIVRCPIFIDTLLAHADSIKEDSSFSDPRDPDMPFTPIAVRDVARAASDILAKPNQNAEKTYSLVCPSFSLNDQAAALSTVLEKAITVSTVDYDECRTNFMEKGYPEWQIDGSLEVFKLIDEGNEITNDEDTRDFEAITESKATTIEEWCQINADKFR